MECCVCGKKISKSFAPSNCIGNYCAKCAVETQNKDSLVYQLEVAQKEIQILYGLLSSYYIKQGCKAMPTEEWYKAKAEEKLNGNNL